MTNVYRASGDLFLAQRSPATHRFHPASAGWREGGPIIALRFRIVSRGNRSLNDLSIGGVK